MPAVPDRVVPPWPNRVPPWDRWRTGGARGGGDRDRCRCARGRGRRRAGPHHRRIGRRYATSARRRWTAIGRARLALRKRGTPGRRASRGDAKAVDSWKQPPTNHIASGLPGRVFPASRGLCELASPRPVDIAGTLVFPDHLAGAVQFVDALALMTGHQNMAVGQAHHRLDLGSIQFEKFFPLGIVLHHLVVLKLGDENMAVRPQIDTVAIRGVIRGKTLETLSGRVYRDAHTLSRQVDGEAFPRPRSIHHAVGNIVEDINLLAGAVNLHKRSF